MTAVVIPRLRMFAGPNGSGKSTIKEVVPDKLLGVYINPDEIEKELRNTGKLLLSNYGINPQDKAVIDYLENSSLLNNAGLLQEVNDISCKNGVIKFSNIELNSYYASAIASFIREELLANGISFTFETVMSSPDKVEFLAKARQKGFRTYLYFIATEDPQINISRVTHRVKVGGHPVPEDKIVNRYYRTLKLLPQAVKNTDRAYFFDNSGSESVYLAEIESAEELTYHSETIPVWFDNFLQEISSKE